MSPDARRPTLDARRPAAPPSGTTGREAIRFDDEPYAGTPYIPSNSRTASPTVRTARTKKPGVIVRSSSLGRW